MSALHSYLGELRGLLEVVGLFDGVDAHQVGRHVLEALAHLLQPLVGQRLVAHLQQSNSTFVFLRQWHGICNYFAHCDEKIRGERAARIVLVVNGTGGLPVKGRG